MSLNLDTNAWYQINVTRFTGLSLRGTVLYDKDHKAGAAFYTTSNTSDPSQYWQFYPYNASVYLLRCKTPGSKAYLGATQTTNKGVTGNTSPYVADYSISDASMFWTVEPWGDGTYYLWNLGNGSDWRMNVLQTALLAMDSNITSEQSGEHFSFTTLGAIDADRYSTVSTYLTSTQSAGPTATTTWSSTNQITSSSLSSATEPSISSTSRPSPSSSSGLSTGAAVGIGVSIGVAFIVGAIAAFLILRRRRNSSAGALPPSSGWAGHTGPPQEIKSDGMWHELSAPGVAAAEMPDRPSWSEGRRPVDSRFHEQPVEMMGNGLHAPGHVAELPGSR